MRGDGRIYQKPGSRYWHMEFWLDGEPVRSSTGEADPERAERVLRRRLTEAKRGDAVSGEERLLLGNLFTILEDNYKLKRNRSLDTMRHSFCHLLRYFGEKAKAVKLGARIDDYVAARRQEGAAEGSIRIELALLDRAFKLAVIKKRLSPRARPYIEKPPEDPNSVRRGFFRREAVERLCQHLPALIADVVLFLFFCPWRVGATRRLEWRDYSAIDQALTLRADLNKTKREVKIPVDPEHTPELMAVIEHQQARRRPDCPFIFHGKLCGTARFDQNGNRRPCLGDFQKIWDRACITIGYSRPNPKNSKEVRAARTPHDLRRSGVKHYIDAGVDPHTVMQWSGHRTESMLRRYHIIDLDDLRRAGKRASKYQGPKDNVSHPGFGRTRTEPAQGLEKSRPASDASESVVELSER
jgi:integrase